MRGGLNCAAMRWCPAVLAALLAPPLALAAGPGDFRRVRLDNGLRVLVQEDHRAPLVSVGIMYAAGARNESARPASRTTSST